MKDIHELLQLLDLEKIEKNLFRGQNSDIGSPQVFGGQVLAQALVAATRTVPPERLAHSMHAYFILRGKLNMPIIYQVEAVRDGGSFTTRRVKAIQDGRDIFILAVSFKENTEGYDHQIPMPEVPAPETLPTRQDIVAEYGDKWPQLMKYIFSLDRPIEFRPVEKYDFFNIGKRDPYQCVWFKSIGAMPDDRHLHRSVLAYTSDYNLLNTAILPHGETANFGNTFFASLDHAMWFHRDFRIDQWLLYAIDSPSASNEMGFCRGNIFTQDGNLVASVVQEGLVRRFRGT